MAAAQASASRGVTTTAAVMGAALKHDGRTVNSLNNATAIELRLSYEANSTRQTITRTVSFESNSSLRALYDDIQSGTPLSISYLRDDPKVMKFDPAYEEGAAYTCS